MLYAVHEAAYRSAAPLRLASEFAREAGYAGVLRISMDKEEAFT